MTTRICFVCLGNICRSPTAEGVMRYLAESADVDVEVESAGTSGWHVGERPDSRARAAAASRGIRVDGAAAQFHASDFERFDLVVAMDRANRAELQKLRADAEVHLLRAFDPKSPEDAEVPDPYYGGAGGFEEVLDICEAACRGLLDHLARRP